MGLIEAYHRTLETCELEARMAALEAGAAWRTVKAAGDVV